MCCRLDAMGCGLASVTRLEIGPRYQGEGYRYHIANKSHSSGTRLQISPGVISISGSSRVVVYLIGLFAAGSVIVQSIVSEEHVFSRQHR